MALSLVTQEHIDIFSKKLTQIVDAEIENGNKIVETYQGWPYEESIFIGLESPFFGNYNLEGVEHRNVNDIKSWKEEYFEPSTKHLLVCRFDMTKPPPVSW